MQILSLFRRATEESILAIQIFDQKKFKKRDQGFLGVINVRIGSVIDLEMEGDGMKSAGVSSTILPFVLILYTLQKCLRVI